MRPLTRTLCAILFVLTISSAAPAATITVTGTGDAIAADGTVTLREAITAINGGTDTSDVVAAGSYGTGDTINFNIPGGGVKTIVLSSALPQINKTVTINGYSQPGSSPNTQAIGDNAVLNIVIDGVNGAFNGVQQGIFAGTGSVFRGLVLQRCNTGILLQSGNNTVAGNFIGTNAAGTAAAGNNYGISVAFNNAFGAPAQGNNTIGGPLPADRNVISGNAFIGLAMNNSGTANPVQGNYIGVNAAGTAALGNGTGIYIGNISISATLAGPSIGGLTATPGTGAGNVVSGNSGAEGIIIQDNGGAFEIVGAGAIQGNIVGLDATGTVAIPNATTGIRLDDGNVDSGAAARLGPITIGGSTTGAGNIISGNVEAIRAVAAGTVIESNRIGTDITGTLARPNGTGVIIGSFLQFGSTATIGAAGAGNVISGNSGNAIQLRLSTATVSANLIGTAADGTTALGNTGMGVIVDSSEAVVGDGTSANANTIAYNGNTGVDVIIQTAGHATADAQIDGNSIYQNGRAQSFTGIMGINLDANDLLTPNDAGDPDTGPNSLQNFPVLSAATISGGNVSVSGTLNSTPSSTYRIELFSNVVCDANGGFGEGKTFLGFTTVTTDSAGNAAFGPTSFAIPAGEAVITSTATNAANQTSEFSGCLTAAASGGFPHGDANGDGSVTVADVFYLINFLFAGGTAPIGPADVNGDGFVTAADVFYLTNYLFAGGPAPK